MAKSVLKKDRAASYIASAVEDKGKTVFDENGLFNRSLLTDLYETNWMVRRICEGFAKDMTAKGVTWKLDQERTKLLETEFRRLNVWRILTEAITFARLYGGSIVVIDMADNAPAAELNPNGTLLGFRVFDSTEAIPNSRYIQFGVHAGQPTEYDVCPMDGRTVSFKVNRSRTLRFEGARCTHSKKAFNDGWGDSVLVAANNAINQYGSSLTSSLELLKRCYLRFLGIKNFWEGLQDDDQASFMGESARMINSVQNVSGLTIADSEDSFQTQSYSFGGIRDVLTTFSEQVAGATGYPIVKLFGMSPSGFSTGEADLANYYDTLISEQEDQLRYPITEIAKIILSGAKYPTEDIDFDFVPYKQETTQEKIANAQTAINAILTVHEAGLISDARALEEIRSASEPSGLFSTVNEEDLKAVQEIIPPPVEAEENTLDKNGEAI